MDPLVTIILPNYNHAQFLKKRIDTILNQTYSNIELIILDDCSTDNSIEIINSYSKLKCISNVIINEFNSGSTFLQWEKGLSLAKGKYIWIAESDDYADIKFLEILVAILENNLECNITYSCSHIIDENDNILEPWDKIISDSCIKYDGKEFVKNNMLIGNSIYNASMVLFRKSALKNINKNYTRYKFCGDWFFWNQLCIQGSVIKCFNKLNYFRQHLNKATPKAYSLGLNFIEGKYVIADTINTLRFNKIQQIVLEGYLLRSIRRFKSIKDKDIRNKVYNDVKEYFNSYSCYIYIFRLDRTFNFSRLYIKKKK